MNPDDAGQTIINLDNRNNFQSNYENFEVPHQKFNFTNSYEQNSENAFKNREEQKYRRKSKFDNY
jgi:hypothetical protein